MFSTASFKNTSRAALAALVIGAASLGAMPARAESTNFGFSFNSGNGLSFSINEGQRQQRANPGDYRQRRYEAPRQFQRVCLTDHQIRKDLQQSGFSNIRFGKERRGDVRVVAERGRWEYVLMVDRCDGQVATLDRQRIRKARHDAPNSLTFQFNVR